jgi:8-oxo-dGTP pyrophosphatase MutT (NUDIX family)
MPNASEDFFLSEGRLTPGDASVALIVLDDSRYLMQLRDQKPGIFFPGHWGCFGGGMDAGETPEAALRRELQEELGFNLQSMTYFTRFAFDFSCWGSRLLDRHYYEVKIAASAVEAMTLGEGSAMRAFDGRELLANEKVTPYDSVAIWMHLTKLVHQL